VRLTSDDHAEVARIDPRTPAEPAEFARLRTDAIDELETADRFRLVRSVDKNLSGSA
jgi:hypothetical protein